MVTISLNIISNTTNYNRNDIIKYITYDYNNMNHKYAIVIHNNNMNHHIENYHYIGSVLSQTNFIFAHIHIIIEDINMYNDNNIKDYFMEMISLI
jgi:hypothetical protein